MTNEESKQKAQLSPNYLLCSRVSLVYLIRFGINSHKFKF
jgi:hypothetical protein